MFETSQEPGAAPTLKKPYSKPLLRVFGTVAAITHSISMAGQQRDGGNNSLKT